MLNKLKTYQPVIYFLLFPILFIGFGFQVALSYGDPRWGLALLFYFYVLINQFLYEFLKKSTLLKVTLSYFALAAAELINLGLIFILYYQMKSTQLLIVLLFYTISRQLIIFFYFYPPAVGWIAVVSETLLNVFLLNGISQYLQNKFLLLKFNPALIPFAIAYAWYLTKERKLSYERKWKFASIGSLVLSFIFIYLQSVKCWLFLLLIISPFLWKVFNGKETRDDLKSLAFLSGIMSLFFNYL